MPINPAVVPPDDAQAIALRLEDWREAYAPDGPEQEWLFCQLVVESLRIERCQRHEAILVAHSAQRAALCWQDDRRLDAETLAASLSKKPALVARKLRRTRQGCEWLLDRWLALAAIFDNAGAWTENQLSLAFDLLGAPPELRDSPPTLEVAHREIAALKSFKAAALDNLDETERQAALAGLEIEPSRPLSLLRRYEAACIRRLHWARKLLKSPAPPSSNHDECPRPSQPPAPEPPRAPRESFPTLLDLDPETLSPQDRETWFRDAEIALYGHPLTPPATLNVPAAPSAPVLNRRARRAALKTSR